MSLGAKKYGYGRLLFSYYYIAAILTLYFSLPSLSSLFLFSFFTVLGAVDEPMYKGQGSVQTFLLLVAFACVPWLLLVKPLILRSQNKKAMAIIAPGED